MPSSTIDLPVAGVLECFEDADAEGEKRTKPVVLLEDAQTALQVAHDATRACLDVLLRMIPDFLSETGAKCTTDEEHNEAIGQAAVTLYGSDREAWPASTRAAAEGLYD